MIAVTILFLAVFHQASAHAAPLSLAPVSVISDLPFVNASGNCSLVGHDLKLFRARYLTNAKLISNYAKNLATAVGHWYVVLKPLENTKVNFRAGSFSAVGTTASNIDASAAKISAWLNQIDADIQTFSKSIDVCKMTPAAHDQWTTAFASFTDKSDQSVSITGDYFNSTSTDLRTWTKQWSDFETHDVDMTADQFEALLETSQGLLESADLILSNAQLAIDELSSISTGGPLNGRGANVGAIQLYRR